MSPIAPIEIKSSIPIPVFSNFLAMYTTNLKFLSTKICRASLALSPDNWLIISDSSSGGNGGGRPDFAQAGGKDVSKLDAALSFVKENIK